MLNITTKREVLDGLVNTAKSFTSENLGTQSHLHGILIRADKETGEVRLTAENDTSAVEFSTYEIDIHDEGEILVNGSYLRTVLDVMPFQHPITIKQTSKTIVHISAGNTEVNLGVTTIDREANKAVLVPKVGDATDPSVAIRSSEFSMAYSQGSVATDFAGSGGKAVDNVLLRGDEKSLLVGAMNRGSATYSHADASILSPFNTLVRPGVIGGIVGYIANSDIVTLSYGSEFSVEKGEQIVQTRSIHVHTYVWNGGKKGDKKKGERKVPFDKTPHESEEFDLGYHIRFATAAAPVEKHPLNTPQMLNNIKSMANAASGSYLVTSREDFFRVIDNASRISRLDRNDQVIRVYGKIDGDRIKVSIPGETSFEDFIPIKKGTLEEGAFIIGWGTSRPEFATYPNEDDIRLHFMSEGEKFKAAILITESGAERILDEGELPDDYLAFVSMANEKS